MAGRRRGGPGDAVHDAQGPVGTYPPKTILLVGISTILALLLAVPVGMIQAVRRNMPGIFGGALITEAVFNYPGIGYLFYLAAGNSDYPVLLGITVVVAVATVAGSLLADIAYAMLDPRVRYVRQ